MLGDPDRDLRQLLDLMTRRLAHRHPLGLAEHVATPTAAGPVIDELINRPRRQQLAPMTLMPGLPAGLAPRGVLAAPRGAPRRILSSAAATNYASSGQLTLEPLDPRLELRDPAIHRQQHLDYRLTPRVIDRLSLSPLHTHRFDNAQLCPPTN